MDEPTRKSLIESIQAYDARTFLDACNVVEDDALSTFFTNYFALPDRTHIFQHGPASIRKRRTEFFRRLIAALDEGGAFESSIILTEKLKVAHSAEELFADIKQAIGLCDISCHPPEVQFWSYIKQLEKKLTMLHSKARSDFERAVEKGFQVSPVLNVLQGASGEEYAPDYVAELYVVTYCMAIKLLAYKHGLFSASGELIAPEYTQVDDETSDQVDAIEHLAVAWRKLEEAADRVMLFGGSVEIKKGEAVPEDARDGGVHESYHWEPDYTAFELHDHVAALRAADQISHHYFKAVLEFKAHHYVVGDISLIRTLDDGTFLFEDEISSLVYLSNRFCEDFISSKEEYLGLTVREWVRSYACLKYLGVKSGESAAGAAVTKGFLVEHISRGGISTEKAETFIRMISFNSNATDLFDNPLIQVRNGLFYIIYPVVRSMSLSAPLASLFSALNVEFDRKGPNFEAEIADKIKSNGIDAKSFKFKRGDQEYEYDVVFLLDKCAFICECKNRSLSGARPLPAARFKKVMDGAAAQARRLAHGLKQHPDAFMDVFGKNIDDYEIVPVVINCQEFSFAGKYRDVYITDKSSFGKFLEDKSINYECYSKDLPIEIIKPDVHVFWKGERPTSEELLRHLERPIQLEVYFNNLRIGRQWMPMPNGKAFTFTALHSDQRRGLEKKFGHHVNDAILRENLTETTGIGSLYKASGRASADPSRELTNKRMEDKKKRKDARRRQRQSRRASRSRR